MDICKIISYDTILVGKEGSSVTTINTVSVIFVSSNEAIKRGRTHL